MRLCLDADEGSIGLGLIIIIIYYFDKIIKLFCFD